MGWYSNAFVFAQAPRWGALAKLGARYTGLWGYKHRTRDVWLATIPATADERTSPFAVDVPTDFRTDRSGARHALDRFDKVARALGTQYLDLCVGYVHLTLEVAQRAGVPTFFFAADDEFRDVGCRAGPDGLEQFAGKFPDFLVRYGDRRLTVLVPQVDGLQSFPAARLERCRRLKDVAVVTHDSPPPPLPSAPPRSGRGGTPELRSRMGRTTWTGGGRSTASRWSCGPRRRATRAKSSGSARGTCGTGSTTTSTPCFAGRAGRPRARPAESPPHPAGQARTPRASARTR